MEEWLPDVDSNHGHGDEHTLAIPASSPLLRFSSTRSVWERKTARSAPIAKRKPRIMTARASTPPAETSIVLARTNSGEAQVLLASSVHHSLDRIADRNGIQRVNIGALRHSFGTWAKQFGKEIRPAADGIPLATIAAIMGHNAKTNADFYQEAVPALALIPINLVHRDDPQPEQDRRAVGALERSWLVVSVCCALEGS